MLHFLESLGETAMHRIFLTLLLFLPLSASRTAYSGAAIGGVSALTFGVALHLYRAAQQELDEARSRIGGQDEPKITALTKRITLLKRILYISGATTLLGAGVAIAAWRQSARPHETRQTTNKSLIQKILDGSILHTKKAPTPNKPHLPSTQIPPASDGAAAAPVTTYPFANRLVSGMLKLRHPEHPPLTGMTAAQITALPSWRLDNWAEIDRVARVMEGQAPYHAEMVVRFLMLSTAPEGHVNTIFSYGIPISYVCLNIHTHPKTSSARFPDLDRKVIYSRSHLILLIWLHFAQGISLEVLREWWEPVRRKMPTDPTTQNIDDAFKVVARISTATSDEEQAAVVDHVLGHMIRGEFLTD